MHGNTGGTNNGSLGGDSSRSSHRSGSNGRYRQHDLLPRDSNTITVATDETEVLPGAQHIPSSAASSDSIEDRTVNNRRHQRKTEPDIGEEEKQLEDTANNNSNTTGTTPIIEAETCTGW